MNVFHQKKKSQLFHKYSNKSVFRTYMMHSRNIDDWKINCPFSTQVSKKKKKRLATPMISAEGNVVLSMLNRQLHASKQ